MLMANYGEILYLDNMSVEERIRHLLTKMGIGKVCFVRSKDNRDSVLFFELLEICIKDAFFVILKLFTSIFVKKIA